MKQWLSLGFALISSCAFSAYQYDCVPPKYSTFQKVMVVQMLTATTIKIDGHGLARDLEYRPRLSKQYLRYDGDTSFLTSDIHGIDVLIHEDMLYAENKTSMKILFRGEDFNDYFSCFLR